MAVPKNLRTTSSSIYAKDYSMSFDDYVFDEHKFASRLIRTKCKIELSQTNLNIVACYYRENKNDDDYIKAKLEKFIKKNQDILHKKDYTKKIISAINYSRVNELYKNKKVKFTEKELEIIFSFDTIQKQNAAFVLCCIIKHQTDKSKPKNGWYSFKAQGVIKYAMFNNVKQIDIKSLKIVIKEMKEKGFLEKIGDTFYLSFIEDTNVKEPIFELMCDNESMIDNFIDYAISIGR